MVRDSGGMSELEWLLFAKGCATGHGISSHS